MIQRAEYLDFLLESPQPSRIARKSLGQYLHRNFTAQSCIARTVDLAHPSGTRRRHNFIGAESRTHRKSHHSPVKCRAAL
jgi:hypothetical protein